MLDLVHRWTGGLIGLLLAVMGATGTFLLHQAAYLRLTLPYATDPIVGDDSRLDALMAQLSADTGHRLRAIRPAGRGVGVHRIYYAGGKAGAYVDQSGHYVARWSSEWQRPEVWVFDLHHHLFVGAIGTTMVGIAALAGLGFVLTGTLL